MNLVTTTLILVPVLLLGDLLRTRLTPGRDYSASLKLALAIGLGSGGLAILMFYTSVLFDRAAFKITTISLLIISLVYLVQRRHDIIKVSRLAWTLQPARRTLIPVILMAVALGLLGAGSLSSGFGYDGLAIWAFKGKILFFEGGWPSPAEGLLPRPDYPLLVPTQLGWVYGILNQVDEQAGKIVFVMFFVALVALYYGAVNRLYNFGLTLIFTVLMLFTPLVALLSQSGYADVPLMLYIFGGTFFVYLWLSGHRTADLLLGATLAALAVWVKREGIVYWLITLLLLVGHSISTRRSRTRSQRAQSVLLFLVLGALIFGPWYLYGFSHQVPNTDYVSISADVLVTNIDRIPIVATSLGRELLLSFGKWGLLWFLFLLVTIWQRHQLREFSKLYLWLSIVLPILVLSFAYIFSTRNPTNHINTSLDRLISHVVPSAWFFIATTMVALNTWWQHLVAPE